MPGSVKNKKEGIRAILKDITNIYKNTPKLKYLIAFGILLLSGSFIIHFYDLPSNDKRITSSNLLEALGNTAKDFFYNSWIEIICALFIFYILDAKIKNVFVVPENAGRRNHEEILNTFCDSKEAHKKIRILDTSIHTYTESYDLFKKSLITALQNPKLEIEILLLHPDTFAAEQRRKDLGREVDSVLLKMKSGFGKLYNCIQEINKVEKNNRITVKLFKATPIMIYTAWDDKANFGLLPSSNLADNNDTFLVYLRTDLGKRFTEYFDELWNNDEKTILLEDYLFLKIENGSAICDGIYWGGTMEDYETPKYIIFSNRHNLIEDIFTSKKKIIINHDGKRMIAELVNKFVNQSVNEYEFLIDRIKKTFGGELDIESIKDNPIYEIGYFYEKFEIRLNEIDFIKNRLHRKGYTFVSHKQYDINLNKATEDFLQRFKYCMEYFLEVDQYDLNAITEIKKKHLEFKCNPRKRLYAAAKCILKDGKTDVVFEKEISHYVSPFYFRYKDGYFGKVEKRHFKNIFEKQSELENLNLQDEKKTMSLLIKYLESILMADLVYILGQEKFSLSDSVFEVYIHLIRTEVGKNSNLNDVAHPTPQGYQKSSCQFQVTHLIARENITGGVNCIKLDGIEPDSLLLQKPFDAAFFGNEFGEENKKTDIQHYTKPIGLSPGSPKGYRDVLVFEFNKIK
jgi:hypothetical protein